MLYSNSFSSRAFSARSAGICLLSGFVTLACLNASAAAESGATSRDKRLAFAFEPLRLPFRVGLPSLCKIGAELCLCQSFLCRRDARFRLFDLCSLLCESGGFFYQLLFLLLLLPLIFGRVLFAAADFAALQAVIPRHLLMEFVLQIPERGLRAALFPKLRGTNFWLL